MNIEQCFRILEVPRDASLDEVKQAYRTLVNVWHPDRFAHNPALQARASDKLKNINLAYETLSRFFTQSSSVGNQANEDRENRNRQRKKDREGRGHEERQGGEQAQAQQDHEDQSREQERTTKKNDPASVVLGVILGLCAGVMAACAFYPCIPLIILITVVGAVIAIDIRKRKELAESGIDRIDMMDGQDFEKYLRSLFKKLGYKVELTRYVGDLGADLIISNGGERTAVQAKRSKANVGIKAVQEIVAAKSHYRCEMAMVVTNSYFTPQAKRLALSNAVILWDRRDLLKKIIAVKKNRESDAPLKTKIAFFGYYFLLTLVASVLCFGLVLYIGSSSDRNSSRNAPSETTLGNVNEDSAASKAQSGSNLSAQKATKPKTTPGSVGPANAAAVGSTQTGPHALIQEPSARPHPGPAQAQKNSQNLHLVYSGRWADYFIPESDIEGDAKTYASTGHFTVELHSVYKGRARANMIRNAKKMLGTGKMIASPEKGNPDLLGPIITTASFDTRKKTVTLSGKQLYLDSNGRAIGTVKVQQTYPLDSPKYATLNDIGATIESILPVAGVGRQGDQNQGAIHQEKPQTRPTAEQVEEGLRNRDHQGRPTQQQPEREIIPPGQDDTYPPYSHSWQ